MAISQLLTGSGEQGMNKACEAAAREQAITIAAHEASKHEAKALAYRFIQKAITELKPDAATEDALWELLCRARSERY